MCFTVGDQVTAWTLVPPGAAAPAQSSHLTRAASTLVSVDHSRFQTGHFTHVHNCLGAGIAQAV
jgi:hypothetical protein